MSVKPGMTIEIVLDLPSGRQHNLKAVLYDNAGDRLIASQTTPPLLSASRGETVQITYVQKKDDVARRFGFSAVISGFLTDYELSDGDFVPALVLYTKSKPQEINVRKAFRVRPTGDSGISLTIKGDKYPIFDISLTGVSFTQFPCRNVFNRNDLVEGSLYIDGRRYPLKAKVIREQERQGGRLTALFFTEMEQILHDVLNKKILMLQRQDMKRWF